MESLSSAGVGMGSAGEENEKLVCRFMGMTGCDRDTGVFCLEAADGEFWTAKALYEKQVVSGTVPSCPPDALEQEEKLVQKKFGWNGLTERFELNVPGMTATMNDSIVSGAQAILGIGGAVLWVAFAMLMSGRGRN